jgi:hypothetical protein
MAEIWHRRGVAATGHMARAKAPKGQSLRIVHDQEQAIPIRELDATTHPPLQHNQLMSECRILCLKSALRLEQRGEQGQEEAEQRHHRR